MCAVNFNKMRIINYLGSEGDSIVIERPSDIYCLLDWCQSRFMELSESSNNDIHKNKFEAAADYLDKLMEQSESDGFGSFEDIDNVQYS